MPLFHATSRKYSPGDVIVAHDLTPLYADVVAALESSRPMGMPSRSVCVFAADSVEAASAFFNAQRPEASEQIHVYEVAMNSYHRAPFRIIDAIRKRILSGTALGQLVAEYWSPQKDWVFWEYFGPSFSVVDEMTPATYAQEYTFKRHYERDSKLIASF